MARVADFWPLRPCCNLCWQEIAKDTLPAQSQMTERPNKRTSVGKCPDLAEEEVGTARKKRVVAPTQPESSGREKPKIVAAGPLGLDQAAAAGLKASRSGGHDHGLGHSQGQKGAPGDSNPKSKPSTCAAEHHSIRQVPGLESARSQSLQEKNQKREKQEKKEKKDSKAGREKSKEAQDDSKHKKERKEEKEKRKEKKKEKEKEKEKEKDHEKEKENAEDKAGKKQRTVGEIISEQQRVASVRLAVAQQAAPGERVPYVDAKGGVYSDKPAASLKPQRSSIPAPPLQSVVKVHSLVGPASRISAKRFSDVDTVVEADVLLVDDVNSAMYQPEALQARLYGKRLCDVQWAKSKHKEGQCVSYQPALHFHLHLWLSERFCRESKKYSDVLLAAAGHADSKHRLHVHVGQMPEKPRHPRLSYQVASGSELASARGSSAPILSLQGLLAKLSGVHDPAQRA